MAFFLDQFQDLKIQLEDIKAATDNFSDDNKIGRGGFGKVYKGEISHSKGRSMVAFKRLDLDGGSGQGNSEFLKEIMMLSRCTHENLVSLLGYCNEGVEKILVYEHLSRGSLDRHVSDPTLTWLQRLKICLGAARGLNYLHDPAGTQQRIIHRDIKSANILLDENWNAKVSDFGLSKIGPANQQYTFLVSNVAGSFGYLDPLYLEMNVLTKESDVYSFGVVLFEALCGRLCYNYSNGRCESLVRMWKKSYNEKKLDEIISRDLLQQMDVSSLETFSSIAYQCLQKTHEKRPLMADVVEKLEIALQSQELYEGMESLEELYEGVEFQEYITIIKSAIPRLIFRSKEELQALLSKGILVNGGKTWFSLNENGEHCEMISSSELTPRSSHESEFTVKSRFAEFNFVPPSMRFKAHARPQFLSPGIAYTVNLVFDIKYLVRNPKKYEYVALNYKLEGEIKDSTVYFAHEREDGWMTGELYQFTSTKRDFDLQILFDGPQLRHYGPLVIEGIEFRPLQRVASEVDKVDIQPISDLDTDWERKLPEDYEEIIKWSKDSMEWTTKKELYFLFCEGFLINNGEEWFFLANNGKKCLFLPAQAILQKNWWSYLSFPNLRFEKVARDCWNSFFTIRGEIKSEMLSPRTTYTCNLVYKIARKHSISKEIEVRYYPSGFRHRDSHYGYIYLLSPQSPVIGPNVDQDTHNPSQMPKLKGLPQQRNDGWMEVQISEFETSTTLETFKIFFRLDTNNDLPHDTLDGLCVQGIEVKPKILSSL